MIRLEILRCPSPDSESYLQCFDYEISEQGETVATALLSLSRREDIRDISGTPALPISWDRGCLQKKCGACAMLIDGVPELACRHRLPESGKVRLEPLKKFPLVRDLLTDRSIMQENLKRMMVYLESEPELKEKAFHLAYDASSCLQCGICLEVCPEYYVGGDFTGMAAAIPASRVILQSPGRKAGRLKKNYDRYVFEGCGKSLACRRLCPAGIDIDRTLAASNMAAVWASVFLRKE